MTVCNLCKEEKPFTIEYFKPNKKCAGGLIKTCRPCSVAYNTKWKRDNSVKRLARGRELYALNNGKAVRDRAEKRHALKPLRSRAQILRYGMINRSRSANIPFDYEIFTTKYLMEYLQRFPFCACCNLELDLTFKHDHQKHDDSPSIDRIVPALGYVKGNTALLCWRCNNLKRDATREELKTVVDWLENPYKNIL